jgi:hypothetical protein
VIETGFPRGPCSVTSLLEPWHAKSAATITGTAAIMQRFPLHTIIVLPLFPFPPISKRTHSIREYTHFWRVLSKTLRRKTFLEIAVLSEPEQKRPEYFPAFELLLHWALPLINLDLDRLLFLVLFFGDSRHYGDYLPMTIFPVHPAMPSISTLHI